VTIYLFLGNRILGVKRDESLKAGPCGEQLGGSCLELSQLLLLNVRPCEEKRQEGKAKSKAKSKEERAGTSSLVDLLAKSGAFSVTLFTVSGVGLLTSGLEGTSWRLVSSFFSCGAKRGQGIVAFDQGSTSVSDGRCSHRL